MSQHVNPPESGVRRSERTERSAVIFGAGSVGRGLIAELLCEAGWQVTFLDVVPALVTALATEHSYPHVTVSNTDVVRKLVGPVTAVDARDTDAAVAAVTSADLAVTCVGARILPAVADTLAKAVVIRISTGRPPLDILLAENLHAAATVMRDLLAERLPTIDPVVLDSQVGLMETSIGRMIPDPARLGTEPTAIYVEPYRRLPYDAAAGRGARLDIPGLVADPTVPFDFYSDRKLYVHNMGHCFAAYLGNLVGATTIWEAIADPGIRYLVRAAMVESVAGLSVCYGVPLPGLLAHVDDLLYRFGNRQLGDTVERVGRDPERKMAAGDRLLGALANAASQGLPGHHLSLAVAAGAVRLRDAGWSDDHLWLHLAAALGADVLDERRTLLAAQIAGIATGLDFSQQIALIESAYEPSHVI